MLTHVLIQRSQEFLLDLLRKSGLCGDLRDDHGTQLHLCVGQISNRDSVSVKAEVSVRKARLPIDKLEDCKRVQELYPVFSPLHARLRWQSGIIAGTDYASLLYFIVYN